MANWQQLPVLPWHSSAKHSGKFVHLFLLLSPNTLGPVNKNGGKVVPTQRDAVDLHYDNYRMPGPVRHFLSFLSLSVGALCPSHPLRCRNPLHWHGPAIGTLCLRRECLTLTPRHMPWLPSAPGNGIVPMEAQSTAHTPHIEGTISATT